ncbi:MAG: GNAT family N-acetyltransferase [Eubacteriales bacterium]|nr:GNAT family N-acetyltransferase [Eubacteriales bacterium]
MGVYEVCPSYENELIMLRPLRQGDAPSLLRCYSDPYAAPFFNGDNCHGDDFRYTTPERMQQAVDMWLESYRTRQFVRWVIEDSAMGRVIGTVEMFHSDDADRPQPYGVLRIDLQSAYETRAYLLAVLRLCLEHFYEDFDVREIVTKGWPDAFERRAALEALGFIPTDFRAYAHYFKKEKD